MNEKGSDRFFLLVNAQAKHIDTMLGWFNDAAGIASWGGPAFRFPFTRETFYEDCRWCDMASYVLIDASGTMLGFGQIYERSGRIHLARICINPKSRNSGIGKVMLQNLMDEGRQLLSLQEYSLFVRRDNPAAIRLYSGAGFENSTFPKGAPMQDTCYYMTRPG